MVHETDQNRQDTANDKPKNPFLITKWRPDIIVRNWYWTRLISFVYPLIKPIHLSSRLIVSSWWATWQVWQAWQVYWRKTQYWPHRGTCMYNIKMINAWTVASLQWRHNGRDGVSNHQPHHCWIKRLFRRRSKKTPKLRVTGLCEGNSPVTGEFPAQMASNMENVSIWWRHHENMKTIQHSMKKNQKKKHHDNTVCSAMDGVYTQHVWYIHSYYLNINA